MKVLIKHFFKQKSSKIPWHFPLIKLTSNSPLLRNTLLPDVGAEWGEGRVGKLATAELVASPFYLSTVPPVS